MDYIYDLTTQLELVERISPNHYFNYLYTSLRGQWRKTLAEWTRRPPLPGAWAAIDPSKTTAGRAYHLTLTLSSGPHTLTAGSRIAVFFPTRFGGRANSANLGLLRGSQPGGRGAKVIAEHGDDTVELETIVHSIGSAFTCTEIVVRQGTIADGTLIRLRIGKDKPVMIAEHRNRYCFRIAVDQAGDGQFRPIRPDPWIENSGGPAALMHCYVPAAPRAGEPVDLHIVGADRINGNPDIGLNGTATVSLKYGGSRTTEDITIAYQEGVARIPAITVPPGQPTSIQVFDEQHALVGRTNTVYPELLPDYALYFGDLHVHTDLSDGSGSLDHAYRWGRDVERLDFTAVSDHMNRSQSYNYTMADKWTMLQEAAERYHEPHRFVTFNGYELYLDRHRNIYFPDEGMLLADEASEKELTLANLTEWAQGKDFVFIPHNVDDWDTPMLAENQTLVEFTQLGEAKVLQALDLGYKVGFVGLSDNHSGEPGRGPISGVFAPELTRSALFAAFKARRTFATTGARFILTFFVDGLLMGEDRTVTDCAKPRRIQGKVVAPEPIETIELLRSGEIIQTWKPEDEAVAAIDYTDDINLSDLLQRRKLTDERTVYYYLRVRTRNNHAAWSSPVWLTEAQQPLG